MVRVRAGQRAAKVRGKRIGRTKRLRIEFSNRIPEGGLPYSSARVSDHLRTSPTRSQIPNTNTTTTRAKRYLSEVGISSVSRVRILCGDLVIELSELLEVLFNTMDATYLSDLGPE